MPYSIRFARTCVTRVLRRDLIGTSRRGEVRQRKPARSFARSLRLGLPQARLFVYIAWLSLIHIRERPTDGRDGDEWRTRTVKKKEKLHCNLIDCNLQCKDVEPHHSLVRKKKGAGAVRKQELQKVKRTCSAQSLPRAISVVPSCTAVPVGEKKPFSPLSTCYYGFVREEAVWFRDRIHPAPLL
jgi:hypothetical protein